MNFDYALANLMPNDLAPKFYFMDYIFLQAIASSFWLMAHWALDYVFIE